MTFTVRWTTEAEESFRLIIHYLEENRSEKQTQKFVRIVRNKIRKIADFPHMFEASASNSTIRKGVITKQCLLFYQVENDVVVLLYFWDNRRKPRY
ncbi:type II toxin-antitoxin system RelE/ParE family toxin [Dyadobacter sp. 3J3]|uniref:type II toxin-antitoxin system RelE/ParE family toxin n=1 Tax=Dyadobacter sp. 3J3 TaxID=2606600 RepID=UPI001357FCB7|nr:type II toxin-antitoxin system RelE/ParE family toxin [Dyadobacter sp. 3J3]